MTRQQTPAPTTRRSLVSVPVLIRKSGWAQADSSKGKKDWSSTESLISLSAFSRISEGRQIKRYNNIVYSLPTRQVPRPNGTGGRDASPG
jgi:hypothetical protein